MKQEQTLEVARKEKWLISSEDYQGTKRTGGNSLVSVSDDTQEFD